MRKFFMMAICLMFSAMGFAQNDDHALAMVERTQGILVFTDNEPVCKYEILDRDKNHYSWNSSYGAIKNKLIKRALKDFPEADGIILEMSNQHADGAVIIKFVKDPNVPESEYAKARVIKQSGIYVFTECEPISKYKVVDREKVTMTWSGQYSEIRDKLIKKTVKHTPDAEGVILGSTVHCVVKFE